METPTLPRQKVAAAKKIGAVEDYDLGPDW